MARYSDSPESAYLEIGQEQKNKIMNGHIILTETGGVSGTDAIWALEKGSAINIHVYCSSPAEAKKAFSILAQEGEVIGELAANPPPHDNGISCMVKFA